MEMKIVPKLQFLSPQRTSSTAKVEGAIRKSATLEVEVHKEAEVQKEPDTALGQSATSMQEQI
jgi:hypothetical protein